MPTLVVCRSDDMECIDNSEPSGAKCIPFCKSVSNEPNYSPNPPGAKKGTFR